MPAELHQAQQHPGGAPAARHDLHDPRRRQGVAHRRDQHAAAGARCRASRSSVPLHCQDRPVREPVAAVGQHAQEARPVPHPVGPGGLPCRQDEDPVRVERPEVGRDARRVGARRPVAARDRVQPQPRRPPRPRRVRLHPPRPAQVFRLSRPGRVVPARGSAAAAARGPAPAAHLDGGREGRHRVLLWPGVPQLEARRGRHGPAHGRQGALDPLFRSLDSPDLVPDARPLSPCR